MCNFAKNFENKMKSLVDFLENNGIKAENYYHEITIDTLDKQFFKPRNEFSHKGDFGFGLLVAGSYSMAGACILAGRSALRLGLGKLCIHIPKNIYNIVQRAVLEAVYSLDNDDKCFTSLLNTKDYTAIAIGPGLSKEEKTKIALEELLKENKKPLIVDADGLNLLSEIEGFADLLSPNTIITPHPKEFERLFGKFASYKDKLDFMRKFSMQTGVTIVLKGGITAISTKSGDLYFNTIGNAGMATAGSGDVLTGILLGILSQGYSTDYAAKLGVYLHALAGDIAKQRVGEISLIASDIIDNIPEAIKMFAD